MKKVLLFCHNGSMNHGCEAIVRTVVDLLTGNADITLLSDNPDEDRQYGIDRIIRVISSKENAKRDLSFVKAYLKLKLTGEYTDMDLLPYIAAIKKLDHYDLAISIGGDVYCYENYKLYIGIHQLIRKVSRKTVLLGCSLENTLFDDKAFMKDLSSYDYIFCRESITLKMLHEHGYKSAEMYPDSAFSLGTEYVDGLDNEKKYIGLNVSPLVERKETKKNTVVSNYVELVKYLLNNTDYSIVLIPHVVWNSNDDREILTRIKGSFINQDRIIMTEDHNCMELKYIITHCSYFVGARTHSTIAAYSASIPTFVIGYSTKSVGIAKDLFGSYESYVMPVNELKEPDDLLKKFQWIMSNGDCITNSLKEKKAVIDKELKLLKYRLKEVLHE